MSTWFVAGPWVDIDPEAAKEKGLKAGWFLSDEITDDVLQSADIETTMGKFFQSLQGQRMIMVDRENGCVYDGPAVWDAFRQLTWKQRDGGVSFVFQESEMLCTMYFRSHISHGLGEQSLIPLRGRLIRVRDLEKVVEKILALKKVGVD